MLRYELDPEASFVKEWDGFGRFCREVLAVEPLTLLKAHRFALKGEEGAVLASYPDLKFDGGNAAEWSGTWRRNWGRRFVKR